MANSIGAPCVFYRPAACTKHNIEAHCGNDCTRCVDRAAAADAAAAPTCGQLIDMYQVAARKLGHSKLTISGVTQRYRKLVRDAGVSLDAKYGALTTAAMEAAADGWSAKGTSVATIGGLLAAAKSVTGRHVLKEYAKRGVTISPYVLPDHKQAKTHYRTLPRSVLFEINEWRNELYLEKDPQMWMILTLTMGFGMRCRDVRLSKWDDFKVIDGRPYHVYMPQKTKESSGRIVKWEVSEDLWWQIEKKRSVMATYENGRIFRGDGEWGVNWRLGKKFNSALRDRIPAFRETYKAMHELRKAATDQIYRAHGIEAAVAFSGDTAKTIIKHYADTTTVGFRPKSIFDMIGA